MALQWREPIWVPSHSPEDSLLQLKISSQGLENGDFIPLLKKSILENVNNIFWVIKNYKYINLRHTVGVHSLGENGLTSQKAMIYTKQFRLVG